MANLGAGQLGAVTGTGIGLVGDDHLVHQRPMMGSFLDALGVKHENGLIADDHVARPEPEKLAERIRERAREAGEKPGYAAAEAFKRFQF